MELTHFFTVDLGATSGRTILGTLDNGKITYEEITRFPNHIIHATGHCYWDIYALFFEIIKGLKAVAERNVQITSIGIDTWGVDFVFIGKDGEILRQPYSYRDPMTNGIPEEYFEKIPREQLYKITGIQVMNFNSLYQLYSLRKHHCSALEAADKILFMPDALGYLLTGEKVTEYTIASTSQMLDAKTRKLDKKLLESIGLTEARFGRYVQPGEKIGELTPEIQELTHLGAVPVIAVAGHDTGSAVAAVPAEGQDFAYLSSGTWSLMGIEVKEPILTDESYKQNFTNEGGVEGTVRFLKNICGMWLLESCRREWADNNLNYSYPELIDAAMATEAFRSLINPDAPCFANPSSMIKAIQTYCKKTQQPIPETYGELTRCIFDSLALRYRQIFRLLQQIAPFPIKTLHIIGGGSRNKYLNQFTCNAVEVPVVAGPNEGTALGNILLQAKSAGLVSNLDDMRRIIRNSVETEQYQPQDSEVWEKAYDKYLHYYNETI